MNGITFDKCKHYRTSNDIIITPMRHGKSIMKGYCVKEKELSICYGDDCPYLQFKRDELEVRTILAGVAIYFQKLSLDELCYGVNEICKGFKEFTEALQDGNSKFLEEDYK